MPLRWSGVLVFAGCVFQACASSPVTTELPFQFRGGFLWVEVSASRSAEPLLFLLDSGASTSVIDLTTARRLGLALGRRVSVKAVGTTSTGRWPVKLSAKAGLLDLPSEYLALDLKNLSDACGTPVQGLIGADFFHNRAVEIDYTAQRLRVFHALGSDPAGAAVPLETRPHSFCVAVSVNGEPNRWVRVDTGCATALQWVTSKPPGDRRGKALAVGMTEVSIPQILTGLRIGGHHFDTVPTGLHLEPIFPGESGLLGNGLLAQFGSVTIDAASGRLLLGRFPPP